MNAVNEDGRSPLYIASARNRLSVAKYLVTHGARINEATSDGQTPLYTASEYAYSSVVDCLIEHGANIEQPDNYIACEDGALHSVESLIAHKARLNTTGVDRFAASPLSVAAERGHFDIVRTLVGSLSDTHDFQRQENDCC